MRFLRRPKRGQVMRKLVVEEPISASPARAEHPDVVIASLARHNVVSRRALLEADVTEGELKHRIAVQRLRRVHDGVYAIGGADLTLRGRYYAAVLACGDEAALSWRSSAALHDLREPSEKRIDVTIPLGGSRKQTGIRVHLTRHLPPEDLDEVDGIRTTSVARTIVDLAAVLTEQQLRRTVERAQILRVFDAAAIDAAALRGRRGVRTLRRLLAELHDEPDLTRSELEARMLQIIRRADLPEPRVNQIVHGYEVDFHWPELKLIVETDGRATHATEAAFERDRQRDLDLRLRGLEVVRLTWRQVTGEADTVEELLRRYASPS